MKFDTATNKKSKSNLSLDLDFFCIPNKNKLNGNLLSA